MAVTAGEAEAVTLAATADMDVTVAGGRGCDCGCGCGCEQEELCWHYFAGRVVTNNPTRSPRQIEESSPAKYNSNSNHHHHDVTTTISGPQKQHTNAP